MERFGWPTSGIPRSCELTLGYACNARCLFCYNPRLLRDLDRPAISLRRAAQALCLGRKRGCWVATFSGGEPTVHAELPKMIALARKAGYPCIQVISNGLKLADPNYARRLSQAGGNLFKISLHSARPGVHDRLVGVPGAYERCLRAIENLNRLGVKVSANIAINRMNYGELPRYVELLLRLGLTGFCLMYSHYRGVMAANGDKLSVPISKAAPFVEKAVRRMLRAGIPIETRMLMGFPPCILPGHEGLLSEWELTDCEDPLFLPDGKKIEQDPMHASQKMKAEACARCIHANRCAGFDRDYFEIFGGEEFVPLRRASRPIAASPLYA